MARAVRATPGEAAVRRSLITPEGVDLSLRLADAGQRVSAFLLDIVIIVGALIAMSLILLFLGLSLGPSGFGEAAIILWLLGWFVLRNGYFILLETGARAATFGKRALGLRVVARGGERLTADKVIARNLMRELEFYLPLSFLAFEAAEGSADGLTALFGLGWTAVFLFFPFFNRERLRVGDLLAGTWVIVAPKRILSADLLDRAPPAGYRFTREQLDAYGVFELQTLEQVLRDGQYEAVATVAERIRARIGVPDQGFDLDFLEAYYEAARAHMERNLLFGRRRADKHDSGLPPPSLP